MIRMILKTVAAAAVMTALALPGLAQTSSIAGKVVGPDGKPLQDAIIKIERLDIKGNYKTKSNRRGEFFHAGLPLGNYRVICEVGGRDVDSVNNVRTRLGDPLEVNFDLEALKKKQESLARAAESGTLTQEQTREMTPEQKAAYEKQMKERSQQMAKNKALNDAFNAGMTALQAKDWNGAIDHLTKATELDPKQHVVWSNLAEGYSGRAKTKTGAETDADYNKAIEAYQKGIELKPDDAGYHNNLGVIFAAFRKLPEAQAEFAKAVQLDPTQAAKYYFNLGAVLTNTGQSEPAGEAFKKALEADPNHAGAHYQYGIYLMGKATTTPDGKVTPPPGTKDAFVKYLQLEPNGVFAEGAKGMIAAIDATITTSYENPDAKKKVGKKKN